jgi:hypothetical protein
MIVHIGDKQVFCDYCTGLYMNRGSLPYVSIAHRSLKVLDSYPLTRKHMCGGVANFRSMHALSLHG